MRLPDQNKTSLHTNPPWDLRHVSVGRNAADAHHLIFRDVNRRRALHLQKDGPRLQLAMNSCPLELDRLRYRDRMEQEPDIMFAQGRVMPRQPIVISVWSR